MKTELNSNNEDQIKISNSLIESSEEMKNIYAKYLQNHSNVISIIKNVIINIKYRIKFEISTVYIYIYNRTFNVVVLSNSNI